VRSEALLVDGLKSHTFVLDVKSELAYTENGHQRWEAQQDIIVIKKFNGGSRRLSQAYMVICQENRWNKIS
jgi:hypothetical protein